MEKSKHMSMVKMKYSYPIMHLPNMQMICLYILKHAPQVFCLTVIHVTVTTTMYVYSLQGAQSGED
jgi:hypothetical protein